MTLLSRTGLVFALTLLFAAGVPHGAPAQIIDSSSSTAPSTTTPDDTTDKDVPYVPTAESVGARMLEVAGVTEEDVVYDLGSGDGRIPITAAKEFGARGVGVEIDSALVAKARAKAREAGVADKVRFVEGDLFHADLSEATVVALYLWPEVNIQLRPKLLEELDPGDRIVSHDFRMGDWEPERVVDAGEGNTGQEMIFLWTVPETIPDGLKDISDETGSP
jgi:SAM-dependent methyltransferase